MHPADIDTDLLLRDARTGDAWAVAALLERYRQRLNQMVQVRLHPRVRCRIDPSDVVQETLFAASQKMSTYLADQPLPFYPWLRQIAWEKLVHLHDRHLRAAKRSVVREQFQQTELSDESAIDLAQRLIGDASSPSAAALGHELRQRVRQALDDLVDADREMLLLRYLEQMSSKEIAAIMGTSEAAVNMRHMRALERMRRVLASDYCED